MIGYNLGHLVKLSCFRLGNVGSVRKNQCSEHVMRYLMVIRFFDI